jgi:DNA polymerase I-like protein with 3'-5' exonuclease and polymerase domains
VKLEDYWQDLDDQSTIECIIRGWLSDKKKQWVGHNIVFDIITIETYFKINITPQVISDTSLLHHTCISEDPPHGLKTLAAEYISPDAADAQDDLKQNVLAKGGSWTKDQKDMYMADPQVLGRYGALDPYYTLKLHELWYGEIAKQNLHNLWDNEVFPLIAVMKELNSTGICIDVPHFEHLKQEMEKNLIQLEKDIIHAGGDSIAEYEYQKVLNDVKITPRSELGKLLIERGLDTKTGRKDILTWYKEKNKVEHIFSLSSKNDLAFLLFDVLNLPVLKTTKTGGRATDKATLDALLEEVNGEDVILKKIKERSKETKLLNTYVLPILENQIAGKIYPQFNQIGTSSGRFTSSEPINFQTLPRDDLRIKKGFISGPGYCIVNADFSSLEPRAFADQSSEAEIKRVYSEGLDLYSHIYKMVMNDHSVSAREEDPNFLKKVNPEARQKAKGFSLGFAYGMSEYKYSSTMNVPIEEAKEVKNKYFKAFPNLKKYQDTRKIEITSKYYVQNLMGRKRRAKLIPLIQNKYRVSVDDYMRIGRLYLLIQTDPEYIKIADRLKNKGKPIRSEKDFRYAIKNEINNSYNFPIQALAASIANASCVRFQKLVKEHNLDAKLVLQVHDEITVIARKDHATKAAELLQSAMEDNIVTKQISVPMEAEPIITDNLSTAK